MFLEKNLPPLLEQNNLFLVDKKSQKVRYCLDKPTRRQETFNQRFFRFSLKG